MGLLTLALSLALTHASGVSGYSGKQGPLCNQCHSGGGAPSVFLMGPQMLNTGESATYTIEIQGGAGVRAGFNAAASGGATFTAGTGTRVLNGEITHSSLGLFSGSTAAFTFTMTAPTTPGMMTLYAAGNSVNDNQSDSGDFAAAATLDIMVVQAPVVDAGQSDAGAHPDSGVTTTPSHDGGTAGASGDDGDGGSPSSSGAPAVVAYPKGPPPAYVPGSVDGDLGCAASGGAPLLLLLLLALTRRRR